MESHRTSPEVELNQSLLMSRRRPSTGTAKSGAERAKGYRARRKAEGLREVKCRLDAEHLAYLDGLCIMYEVTIADAVAMAITALMRGELPKPRTAACPTERSIILL